MALGNLGRGATPNVRPKIAIPILLTVVLLGLIGTVGVDTWVNLLFFREVGFRKVFSTVLGTKVLLFVLVGLVLGISVAVNAVLAYRMRPPFRPTSVEQQSLDVYRRLTEPYRILLLVAGAVLVAVIAGSAATTHWDTLLAWRHQSSFGVKDPQFHKDVSYYVFTYPFLRFVLGVVFQSLLLSIVVAAGVHYFYGGIRLQTPGDKAVPAAKAHLSILLGLLFLAKAVAYWLDRFGLNFSKRGFVDTGASYTDIHVVLPGKTVLVIVSVLCALLLFANARARGWTLPAVSAGLLVFAAIVVGGVVPAIVQKFSVKPNEIIKESPYIQRNIDATRTAYKLTDTDVTTVPYNPAQPVADAVASKDVGTLPNVRLLDPNLLGPTFEQLQRQKNYYGFGQSLGIDRYTVGGVTREYVVAAREVDQTGLQPSQRNWINEHLVYTHGQGFVAAPTTEVDVQGQPTFTAPGAGGLPQSGAIKVDQSRVYYGELAPEYSVVKTKQQEVDGLDANNSYDGKGGVKVGGLLNKLALAIHFKASNLLLSGAVTSDSKVLYNRDPRTRVKKVAPWLTLDADPYPAVIDGRIVWLLDGYTTTDAYPYAARTSLADATADSENTGSAATRDKQAPAQVNYIRNSVKAVVDAGDGSVKLYAFDETDPILRTWMKVFPGTVQPRSAMSTELISHLRYPEDLFKVQRELLARYHVRDPQTFFKQDAFWSVAGEPTAGQDTAVRQPPFYVMSQTPGQKAPGLNLTTTFNALKRPNLEAFLSVASGPGTQDDPQGQYGHFTLLEMANEADGVQQVHNKFNSTPDFKRDQALFGSGLQYGNLLTLPVGGSLVYVEPVYVTGSGQNYPVLRKVLARWRDRIGYADNISEALRQVFTGQGAVAAPVAGAPAGAVAGAPAGAVASPGGGAPLPAAGAVPSDVGVILGQLEDQQRRTADLIAELRKQIGASPARSSP
jgi:uncharacterized membrane protein (UPF0182 family)